jgi:putative inorganic carbon (HCO3(-)) transporter
MTMVMNGVVFGGGVAAIAFATNAVGATSALAAVAGLATLAGLVLRPAVATLAAMFLLYLNVPAILTQQHGVPEFVAGAFILLLAVPVAAHCVLRRQPLKGGRVLALMILFLATLMLSSTAAVDRMLAIGRVQGFLIEGLLLYWLIVNAIRDVATLRRVMLALLAAGTIVSVLCLYQDVSGRYDQEFGGLAYRNFEVERDAQSVRLGDRGRFSRAQGPVNEPNRFAQIMIVLLPFALYLHRTAASRAVRAAAAVMGAAVLCGIVLTLSRGAIVALGLMAAALVALGWVRASRLSVAAIAAVVVLPMVAPFYLDRVGSIADVRLLGQDDPRGADGALRGRATEMLAAVNVFLDHPVAGVGPGQFARFYVQDYSRDPSIQFRDLTGNRRAHSLYLELAAENGAVGLSVFLAIVATLLLRLWRARQCFASAAPAAADLATACWLSLTAYLCTGMFLHLSYQRYFWVLIALSVVALHQMPARTRRGEPVPAFART